MEEERQMDRRRDGRIAREAEKKKQTMKRVFLEFGMVEIELKLFSTEKKTKCSSFTERSVSDAANWVAYGKRPPLSTKSSKYRSIVLNLYRADDVIHCLGTGDEFNRFFCR